MTDSTTTGATQRPTFLTVLCILSFIGCGLGIFSGISGYFSNKALANLGGGMQDEWKAAMDEAMESAADEEGLGDAGRELAGALGDAMGGLTDFNAMANSSLVVGLLTIVTLIGVVMMWKLKKTGFYVYTAGQIASVAAPFVMVGGLAGGLMATLGAIFPIIFIILYALNLKHMH